MRFESPWSFMVLLAIPVLVYLHMRRHSHGSLRFSSTSHAERSGRSLRQRLLAVLQSPS